MSDIIKILKNNINFSGSISLKEFMSVCLYHDKFGYYNKKEIIGEKGDFITSAEISQVFGELIAAWLVFNSKNFFKDKYNYLELGPGKGTLSKDILRIIKKLDKNFYDNLKNIYFLEKSNSFVDKLKSIKGSKILKALKWPNPKHRLRNLRD